MQGRLAGQLATQARVNEPAQGAWTDPTVLPMLDSALLRIAQDLQQGAAGQLWFEADGNPIGHRAEARRRGERCLAR